MWAIFRNGTILLEKQATFKKIFTNLITTTANKDCSKYNFFINWMK